MSMTEFEDFLCENVGCIESAEMPLKDQGLVLIQGLNMDEGGSNGAGKTTLFEALAHTLYGKTAKGISKNDLLNLQTYADYYTRCRWRRNGHLYMAEQFRKHKEHGTGMRFWEDGIEISKAHSKDVQSMVIENLGKTWPEYSGGTYFSQKYTHAMIDGTPNEKRFYLSAYFGLNTVDTVIKTTTKRLNSVPVPDETQLQELRQTALTEIEQVGDVDAIGREKVKLEQQQKTLQAHQVELLQEVEKQKRARDVQDEKKTWHKKVFDLQLPGGVGNFDVPINTSIALMARSDVLKDYEKQKAILDERDKIIKALKVLDIDLSMSYDQARAEAESLERQISELSPKLPLLSKRDRIKMRLETLKPVEVPFKQLAKEVQAKQTELEAYSTKVAVLRDELAKLTKLKGKCPTCLREIAEHEHTEMLSKRQESCAVFDDAREGLSAELKILREQQNHLEQRMVLLAELEEMGINDPRTYEQAEKLFDDWKRQKKDIQLVADKLVRGKSLQDRLADLPANTEVSLEELPGLIEKTKHEVTVLEGANRWLAKYGDVEFSLYELTRFQEELAETTAEFKTVTAKLVELAEKLTKHATFTKQIADIDRLVSRGDVEKQRVRILQTVQITLKELKKQGLRQASELLTNVLPFYIKQLFPQGNVGVSVADDEDSFELYFNKGGQVIPLLSVSGGQAKRISLAIIFAFAKMGGKTSNLLIVDEPYKDLDLAGRQACYELLRDLDISTIFITSHDQDQQSQKKYDQTWSLVMQNDRSTLQR